MHLLKKKTIMGDKLIFCSIDESLIGENSDFKRISCKYHSLKDANEAYVKTVYENMNQNIKEASKILGIAPNTVRTMIKNYDARM